MRTLLDKSENLKYFLMEYKSEKKTGICKMLRTLTLDNNNGKRACQFEFSLLPYQFYLCNLQIYVFLSSVS